MKHVTLQILTLIEGIHQLKTTLGFTDELSEFSLYDHYLLLSPQTVTINSDTSRESSTASPSFLNGQQGILIYRPLTTITATYSTVPIITEYLWWQWIALRRLPILRNIFIHPLSFLL